MTKTEMLRALKSMQTTTIKQQVGLQGMQLLCNDDAVKRELGDGIITAKNHVSALGHVIGALVESMAEQAEPPTAAE
jgi:hypothetical protein